MLTQLRPALVSTLVFTLLLGVGYPLLITGVAKVVFPVQAEGSLIRDAHGQVIGSALLGQAFALPRYLHPRPSAAGAGYDASGSSGSNLGPLSPDLIKRVGAATDALRGEGAGPVPADAVTASASGLDPDITPANARRQAARIAAARGLPVAAVEHVIDAGVQTPWLGVFGQPRINVLKTNIALDAAFASAHPPGR
jgi:K+-transporting ATPase ATPase C chain